jgi:hypothetical protein
MSCSGISVFLLISIGSGIVWMVFSVLTPVVGVPSPPALLGFELVLVVPVVGTALRLLPQTLASLLASLLWAIRLPRGLRPRLKSLSTRTAPAFFHVHTPLLKAQGLCVPFQRRPKQSVICSQRQWPNHHEGHCFLVPSNLCLAALSFPLPPRMSLQVHAMRLLRPCPFSADARKSKPDWSNVGTSPHFTPMGAAAAVAEALKKAGR